MINLVFPSTPLPVQVVKGAGFTHILCNLQAIEILENDRFTKAANLFSQFLTHMEAGVIWADKGFKSITHHYDPETGLGKWGLANASQVYEGYFNKAIELWKSKRHHRSMFYLGAATHLLQDMCVPHHSRCVILDGHQEYEQWAEDHRQNYRVYDTGLYLEVKTPGDWMHHNALTSRHYYKHVQAGCSDDEYHYATNILLPLAQRSTGGFWLYFYQLVTK